LAKHDEVRLLPPRLLLLSPERRQAAVQLLSELVLEETLRERAVDALSVDDVVVVPFAARATKKRKVA
jgi:hypothetical protein